MLLSYDRIEPMETIKSLILAPVVIPAFLLVVLVLAGRLGCVSDQTNRDAFFLVEMALAIIILLLGSWQAVRSVADTRQQTAFIESLQEQLKAEIARAAQAESTGAVAQRTIEELKTRTAWREITDDQAHEFSTLLWASPKEKVSVSYVTDDPEVAKYALELSQMMRRAGYDAPETLKGMIPLSPMGSPIVGVKISARRADDIAAGGLQQGLRRIGVNIKGRINPAQAEDVLIIVGRKGL